MSDTEKKQLTVQLQDNAMKWPSPHTHVTHVSTQLMGSFQIDLVNSCKRTDMLFWNRISTGLICLNKSSTAPTLKSVRRVDNPNCNVDQCKTKLNTPTTCHGGHFEHLR